jgi:hypothetical protein
MRCLCSVVWNIAVLRSSIRDTTLSIISLRSDTSPGHGYSVGRNPSHIFLMTCQLHKVSDFDRYIFSLFQLKEMSNSERMVWYNRTLVVIGVIDSIVINGRFESLNDTKLDWLLSYRFNEMSAY